MKIISSYDQNYKELSDISAASYVPYCEKNNLIYERYEITETDRPTSWYKIKIIEKEFDAGTDCVLYVDADTLLVNQQFDYETLISTNHDIYFSMDSNGINCGVMIWRNTPLTREILKLWWDLPEHIRHPNTREGCWEQSDFQHLFYSNLFDIQSVTGIVRQNILNAYKYETVSAYWPLGEVNAESFIFHCPGIPLAQKISLMKNFTC